MAFPAVLLLAVLHASPAASTEVLEVVADAYCPYNCEPGSARPGYVVEILERTLGRKGVRVQYRTMGWEQAVAAVREGRSGAIVAAVKGDAPDFVFPRLEIGRSANGFAVRKGDPWRYTGPASLAGRRLGVVEGYDYGAEVQGYVDSADPRTLVRAGGDAPLGRLARDLAAGRVDVVVEDLSVLVFLSEKDPGFRALSPAGSTRGFDPVYVAFSPASPRSAAWARMFDEGLEELRRTGELAAILARYGLKDWR